jgi:hypothetical protein
MIFIAGDTHANIDIKKFDPYYFPDQKYLTKKDYVIVLGDFGVIWNNVRDKLEKELIGYYNNKNWVTLFIPGNH